MTTESVKRKTLIPPLPRSHAHWAESPARETQQAFSCVGIREGRGPLLVTPTYGCDASARGSDAEPRQVFEPGSDRLPGAGFRWCITG